MGFGDRERGRVLLSKGFSPLSIDHRVLLELMGFGSNVCHVFVNR